jgi:hypothetical protein
MEKTKNKIIALVKEYKALYPREYRAFLSYMRDKRLKLKDNYATVKGSQTLKRALYEIPENLDNILMLKLTLEEKTWYKTKEGAMWFAKQFREFLSGRIL